MAEFPDDIYTPRETENLPGIVYNPADKKNMFSEDFQNLGAEINAIEEILGTNPNGIYDTLKEWLQWLTDNMGGGAVWGAITGTLADQTDLNSALAAKQASLGFTPEDVANKKTTMSGNSGSNTYYLSAKAIYDWAVATFQSALGFTPEDVANKSTNLGTDGASNTKYPSCKSVKDYGDANWGGGGFGSWTSKSINTDYQADHDGFIVVGWRETGTGTSSSNQLDIVTDSSSSPSTIRMSARTSQSNDKGGMMCPVKNGDYYNVKQSGGSQVVADYYYFV